MKLNTYQKIALSYLFVLVAYWVFLQTTGHKENKLNYLYSFAFTLVPLFGGLFGMVKAHIWGNLKSAMGRAIFFLSLGLFLWGCGNTIWAYYNFFMDVAAPYPSWADLGFAPSIFFWALGALNLARATGAKYGLRNTWAKFFAVIIPLAVLASSYYLLVVVARDGVLTDGTGGLLKLTLDIAYPLGDVLSLTIAALVFGLSFKFFGGHYKNAIIVILVGLAMMYAGDFMFSYTTTVGTFYNGDFGDLILTLGLFCITFGVLGFASKPVFATAKVEK